LRIISHQSFQRCSLTQPNSRRDQEWAFQKLKNKSKRIKALQQQAAASLKNVFLSKAFRKWLGETQEAVAALIRAARPAPSPAEKRAMKQYDAPGAPEPVPEFKRTKNQIKKDTFNAGKLKQLAALTSVNNDFQDFLHGLPPADRACALLLSDPKIRQKYFHPAQEKCHGREVLDCHVEAIMLMHMREYLRMEYLNNLPFDKKAKVLAGMEPQFHAGYLYTQLRAEKIRLQDVIATYIACHLRTFDSNRVGLYLSSIHPYDRGPVLALSEPVILEATRRTEKGKFDMKDSLAMKRQRMRQEYFDTLSQDERVTLAVDMTNHMDLEHATFHIECILREQREKFAAFASATQALEGNKAQLEELQAQIHLAHKASKKSERKKTPADLKALRMHAKNEKASMRCKNEVTHLLGKATHAKSVLDKMPSVAAILGKAKFEVIEACFNSDLGIHPEDKADVDKNVMQALHKESIAQQYNDWAKQQRNMRRREARRAEEFGFSHSAWRKEDLVDSDDDHWDNADEPDQDELERRAYVQKLEAGNSQKAAGAQGWRGLKGGFRSVVATKEAEAGEVAAQESQAAAAVEAEASIDAEREALSRRSDDALEDTAPTAAVPKESVEPLIAKMTEKKMAPGSFAANAQARLKAQAQSDEHVAAATPSLFPPTAAIVPGEVPPLKIPGTEHAEQELRADTEPAGHHSDHLDDTTLGTPLTGTLAMSNFDTNEAMEKEAEDVEHAIKTPDGEIANKDNAPKKSISEDRWNAGFRNRPTKPKVKVPWCIEVKPHERRPVKEEPRPYGEPVHDRNMTLAESNVFFGKYAATPEVPRWAHGKGRKGLARILAASAVTPKQQPQGANAVAAVVPEGDGWNSVTKAIRDCKQRSKKVNTLLTPLVKPPPPPPPPPAAVVREQAAPVENEATNNHSDTVDPEERNEEAGADTSKEDAVAEDEKETVSAKDDGEGSTLLDMAEDVTGAEIDQDGVVGTEDAGRA